MSTIRSSPTPCVRFGLEHANHLTILARHAYPEAADPWERDLLDAQVELAAGGFRASFQAWFQVAELGQLRDGLARLYHDLFGVVEFAMAYEDQLRLRFEGDGRGHVLLNGVAIDDPGSNNRLDFEFSFDQTELRDALVALDALLRRDGEPWAELCAGTTRPSGP